MTKEEQLERIKNYMAQKMFNDHTGHGLDHSDKWSV